MQPKRLPTAARLSSRFGDAIQSEEDFRKVYALQKAFDDKFPRDAFAGRITPEMPFTSPCPAKPSSSEKQEEP